MSASTLDAILTEMGDTGLRMAQIDAAEGAAGNMSVFVRELSGSFGAQSRRIELPVSAPHLAGGTIVVTGASRRLRDVASRPAATVCLLQIDADGRQATLRAADGVRPTSELNTHLAVHNEHVGRRGLAYHAVVHAQPLRLTYLSHIERYQDQLFFNRRLLRWQPETIIELPEGIGMLPFQMPGSPEQQEITTAALATHRAVVWARHGIVTRADSGIGKAGDLVEYVEAAAQYEYLNIAAGEPSNGLSDDQVRLICERMGIQQAFF